MNKLSFVLSVLYRHFLNYFMFLAAVLFAAAHSDPAPGGDSAEAHEDIDRPAQSARPMEVLPDPGEGEKSWIGLVLKWDLCICLLGLIRVVASLR